MNKKLLFSIIFNFIFSLSKANTDQEKFLQANIFYNQNKFDKALELYKEIKNQNYYVWFNIGNSYYKIGNFADALIAFRRSQEQGSWKNFLKSEQNIAKIYKINNKKYSFKLFNYILGFLNLISLFKLQILFLLLWYILNIFFTKLFINKRIILLVFLLILNICILCFLVTKYLLNNNIAIIIENNVPVFLGPDKTYHEIGVLNFLDEIKIIAQTDIWSKIVSSNFTGWIMSNSLKII